MSHHKFSWWWTSPPHRWKSDWQSFRPKNLYSSISIDRKYCTETCKHRLTTIRPLKRIETLFFNKIQHPRITDFSFFSFNALPYSVNITFIPFHSFHYYVTQPRRKKNHSMFSLIGTIIGSVSEPVFARFCCIYFLLSSSHFIRNSEFYHKVYAFSVKALLRLAFGYGKSMKGNR